MFSSTSFSGGISVSFCFDHRLSRKKTAFQFSLIKVAVQLQSRKPIMLLSVRYASMKLKIHDKIIVSMI